MKRFLKIFSLSQYFQYRNAGKIADDNFSTYYVSLKKYPDSITTHEVNYFPKTMNNRPTVKDSKKILLLTGKSKIKDSNQVAAYEKIINFLDEHGFSCFVKDHPNPAFRLNLKNEKLTQIDCLIPAELLEDQFLFVIGLSSTALLNYDNRSISILNLVNMNEDDREHTISFFNKTNPSHQIRFIDKFEELVNLTTSN